MIEEKKFSSARWAGFLFLRLGWDVRTFVEEGVALVLLESVSDVMVLDFCLFCFGVDGGELGLFGVEGSEGCCC